VPAADCREEDVIVDPRANPSGCTMNCRKASCFWCPASAIWCITQHLQGGECHALLHAVPLDHRMTKDDLTLGDALKRASS
jgi:hypothetical protein